MLETVDVFYSLHLSFLNSRWNPLSSTSSVRKWFSCTCCTAAQTLWAHLRSQQQINSVPTARKQANEGPDTVWTKSWIPASKTGEKQLTWASAQHRAAQGGYSAPDLFHLSWILLYRPCPLYHSLVGRNLLEEMVTWPCYLYVHSLLPLTLHCLQWNPSSSPWAS